MDEKFYGSKDAAAYLGMTWRAFKDHLHRIRDIKGEKVGNALVFTQGELDRFKTTERPGPGRPAKKLAGKTQGKRRL